MSKRLFHLALSAACACLPSLALAQAWDANADYQGNVNTNPNGVWSYGYDPAAVAGYQLRAFDSFQLAPLTQWLDSGHQSLRTPTFGRNSTAQPVTGIAPGQIFLHPGPVANGDAAILRFTAPASGLYAVDARFYTGDSSETDAWLVLNSNVAQPLLNVGVTSVNPVATLPALFLNLGDTLDFVVGNHGDFLFDSTPLEAKVTAVPEPASVLLLVAGLAAVGVRNNWRKV